MAAVANPNTAYHPTNAAERRTTADTREHRSRQPDGPGRSLPKGRRRLSQRLGETFGREIPEELFEQLYARFEKPDVWRIYDEVPAVLRALRARGLALGVVSNWDERLGPLLRALNLASFFQAIVISAEVGYAKPDRRIFAAASERLGVPAESLLHIGDQDDEDVIGARGAGWAALRIDRRQPSPEALAELSPLLEMFRFTG